MYEANTEEKKLFKVDSCNFLAPLDIDKYLIKFLSPTTKGTNYWDSPTEAKIKRLGEREIIRIVKQASELNSLILKFFNFDNLSNIKVLDVGTGNGMVPRFLNVLNAKVFSEGIDPFLHGGHKTSWQKSDFENDINSCINYCKEENDANFKFNYDYAERYKEKRVYLNEHIEETKKNYDCVYCKAIEHVPDWKIFANEICSVVNKNGLLIFKHRSFYSYLGPHRYSSTGIPWGHCLLNKEEYIDYVNKFHPNRVNDMLDFFYKGLSYPRMCLKDLIKLCSKNSLYLETIFLEKPRYFKLQNDIINQRSEIIEKVLEVNRNISFEEMTSGLITIVFRRY